VTYFADLAPYSYSPVPGSFPKLLHVGWLEAGHAVPAGAVDAESTDRLARLCAYAKVAVTRGRYRCHLPQCPTPFATVVVDGDDIGLGAAEIWLPGPGGVWYAAPDLIYHYVTEHDYRPPDEFLVAIHSEDAGKFTETEWRALIRADRAAQDPD